MTKCLTRWWAPQKRVIRFFTWGAIGLRLLSSQHFAIQRPLSIVTVQIFQSKTRVAQTMIRQACKLISCRHVGWPHREGGYHH